MPDAPADVTRRDALRLLAGAAAAGGLAGAARGTDEFVVEQGGDCVPVTPLSGDEPVEAFYDYQLPEGKFAGTAGASDDGGPYFRSLGTEALQRPDTSQLFLYRGPEGLSLVVLHGSLAESDHGGGTATLTFSGLGDGSWVVKDDYYLDPETGEQASSNHDRWRVVGSTRVVTWTWASDTTDGGAFRDVSDALDGGVTVDPAFDDAAEELNFHHDGQVTDWHVLSGSADHPDRHSLALDRPVTIRRGTCEEADEDEEDEHVVCHRPPGNPDNERTIRVGSEAAVEAHLGHGDERGPCDE